MFANRMMCAQGSVLAAAKSRDAQGKMPQYASRGTVKVRWLWQLAATLAWALSVLLWPSGALAQAGGTANIGVINTRVGQIEVGNTKVDVTIPASALSSMRIQAIVPVPGASITLFDPSGNVVVAANDPGLSFADGQLLTPPLPGGVYLTPEIANPRDGNWLLRAQFPSAPARTIALLTVFAASPYQVGIVLSGQTFHVGQPVPVGLLATNLGMPIRGLAPTLTVSKGGITVASSTAADSGLSADFDGLANDGIYSRGFVFSDVGRYLIEGTVVIPSAGGNVLRSVSGFVDITPRYYTLNNVTGGFNTGTGGCISQLNVTANSTAQQAGSYSFAAALKSPDGSTFVKRTTRIQAAPGTFDTTISFTSKEIRSRFSQGGVFTIDPLDVVASVNDAVTLEARRAAAFVYPNLQISRFCADPVEIGISASVTPVLRSGFIGQLNFSLPISVTTAGFYDVTFKVTDSQRNEVGQFAVSMSMASGVVNNVGAIVPASQLQTSDGPFNIESVLITGAGFSAQSSRVPVASSTFARWQFFPTITGDLNGEGSVDVVDRDLILTYRNATPLKPGDRRDLNADGKIDLLDARLLLLRACKSPNCPRN